jgi:hypothetical protein
MASIRQKKVGLLVAEFLIDQPIKNFAVPPRKTLDEKSPTGHDQQRNATTVQSQNPWAAVYAAKCHSR